MQALMQRAGQRMEPEQGESAQHEAGEAPTEERSEDGQPQGATFTKPDITEFIPEQARDAVARVVAAGMKMLYSEQMRQEVVEATKLDMPMPQKLAMSTAALMQTLDEKSQGGIPLEAMFPAGMELLGEGAEIMSAAGQKVTQDDFNQAALQLSILMAKKLGASDDEAMQIHEQMLGEPAEAAPAGPAAAGEPADDWED